MSAPSGLDYSPALHSSIPATATRRFFYPTNGTTFSPTGTKMIRLEMATDSFVDFANSYCMLDFTNLSGGGNAGLSRGVPFIDRIRVLSASGVVLENIEGYNHLHALFMDVSAGSQWNNAQSMFTGQTIERNLTAAQLPATGEAAGGSTSPEQRLMVNQAVSAHRGNRATQVADDGVLTLCFHPLTAITNCSKYFPMLLCQGLTFEFHLAEGNACLCQDGARDGAYSISNFRYVTQLIDIDRTYTDKIRQYQQANGGILTLNGETFTHYLSHMDNAMGPHSFPHALRAKSIKSLFTIFQAQDERAGQQRHNVGHRIDPNVQSWGWRIGSRRYPPTNVEHDNRNGTRISETAQELFKALGVQPQHNVLHGTVLNAENYLVTRGSAPGSYGRYGTFALGIDLDVWSGHGGIEAGINTSDRALQSTLEITCHTLPGGAVDVHTYAMVDAIFYIDSAGQISPSV
jgi:hypothetical protein